MTNQITLAAFLLCIAAFSARGDGDRMVKKPYLGTCIGGFCFKEPRQVLGDVFVKKFGKGYTYPGHPKATRCYYDPSQKTYVRIERSVDYTKVYSYGDLILSSTSLCPGHEKPKMPFPKFVTDEGLKFGDEREKVLATYGVPGRSAEASEGGRAPGYKKLGDNYVSYFSKSEPLGISFYFRDNKISGIHIHYGE